MPSPYLRLRCGATEECTELKRLLEQARFPRVNHGCRHAMLVPPVKAYDAELIGSFFKPFGFDVSTNESAAAADPSQATWAYVPLPPDAVARLPEHDAARLAERTLVVAGLSIGDKAGLCRIARRAEALWPSFAEVAPTPHCLNWPEDAAVAQAELHAGTEPWVFKDTAGSSVNGGGRTYGGLSICFYSPRTDSTKQLVLNSVKKWAVLKSPPLRNWTSSWQAQEELRTSGSRRHPRWSRRRGVFQRLVRPLLYEERAHMFRIFVLVTSTLPLRAWWWRESYAMVAGRPYADAVRDPAASPLLPCCLPCTLLTTVCARAAAAHAGRPRDHDGWYLRDHRQQRLRKGALQEVPQKGLQALHPQAVALHPEGGEEPGARRGGVVATHRARHALRAPCGRRGHHRLAWPVPPRAGYGHRRERPRRRARGESDAWHDRGHGRPQALDARCLGDDDRPLGRLGAHEALACMRDE